MKKLLLAVLFAAFFTTSVTVSFATQPNKIGVGPIELEVPSGYEKSSFTEIELSGGDLSQAYSWQVYNTDSCSGNPCTKELQIPLEPSVEPILNAGKTYTIKLKKVVHITNGQEDPREQVQCIQNCGDAFRYQKQIGQTTGRIKYKWTPAPLSTPVINPQYQTITRSASGTVIVGNLDSRSRYMITLRKDDNRGQTKIEKAADFTVDSKGCTFGRNSLSMTCGSNISPNPSFSLVNGNILINGSSLPASNFNETYVLKVKYFDKNETNPDITKESRFAYGTITIAPDTPPINTFNITLNPSSILPNADQTIGISVTGTEANKEYEFKIETSSTPHTIPKAKAQGSSLSASFRTKKDNNFLFKVVGTYRISVIDQSDSTKRGDTSLQVGPPPTPTPSPPPAGPECPSGCTKIDKDRECAYDSPCGRSDYNDQTSSVLVAECNCPDGVSFVCKEIGPQPPACGAPTPIPTSFPCPVCHDDHPRWDPPRDPNGKCCAKDSKEGECKSPVEKIRDDPCYSAEACGFGIGCGLGTRGPCGKKIVDGKVTDDYECQTAIGLIDTSPNDFVKRLFGLLLGISGGVALLIILYSGYRIMASRGDPEKLQGAKETLTSAIVGLLFIIFSLVILEVVGVDILKIPGLGR